MHLQQLVAPTVDVMSVAEARSWLKFTEGIKEQDSVIESVIDEVMDDLEKRTNRRYGTQTWTVSLDADEISDVIRIPLVPLISISSIVTYDEDGDTTTVDSTYYQVRTGGNPRIALTSVGSWPTDIRKYDSMLITGLAGYNGAKRTEIGFEPASSISPGLNDLTASISTWTGTARTKFEVVIESNTEASPDTIKWRKVTRDADGIKTFGAWTSDVDITGASQALADGVSIKFDSTSGHTVNDQFNVHVIEVLPGKVRQLIKGLVQFNYNSSGKGVMETLSGQIISVPRQLERMIEELRVVPL